MYYVSILHRVPYTTVEYTTETYFIDEVAADNWIDKIFMPHEFHPDLCTIVDRGPNFHHWWSYAEDLKLISSVRTLIERRQHG